MKGIRAVHAISVAGKEEWEEVYMRGHQNKRGNK